MTAAPDTGVTLDGVPVSRLVSHGRDPRDGTTCYGAQRAADGAWRWVWLTPAGTFVRWARGSWSRPVRGGCGWESVPD